MKSWKVDYDGVLIRTSLAKYLTQELCYKLYARRSPAISPNLSTKEKSLSKENQDQATATTTTTTEDKESIQTIGPPTNPLKVLFKKKQQPG
jgi:hypothetical protein